MIGKVAGKRYKRIGIVAAKLSSRIDLSENSVMPPLRSFRTGLIIEPLQYEGTMDSGLFETWFKKRLLPALPPNSTIVMDRASFHRKSRLVPLAEKFRHRIVFRSPYSPEINDIEPF
ncbi:MAG: transposase [Defluviitaleaceae bacterium]|nr:transposase [Defluviitaleaceae bacterium]